MTDPLVVIVDGNREYSLRPVLADHVVVENDAYFIRRGNTVAGFHQSALVLLPDDVHAQFDALVADEHRRSRDQLAHFMLALAAEGAVEGVLRVATCSFAHRFFRATASAESNLRMLTICISGAQSPNSDLVA